MLIKNINIKEKNVKSEVQNRRRRIPFVSEVGKVCIFISERINEKLVRLIASVVG